MYIEKLHIDTFGKLSDMDIELGAGMNIIKGDNESGKSTIAAFIKFILYGVSQKERDSAMSWRTGGAAGSMTVNVSGKRYRIEHAIIANRETLQLIDGDTNMPMRHVLDDTTPGEYFLGVDGEMFEATAFVSQLGSTVADGRHVSEGIENILFSADESVNTQKALTKLDAARAAILHKNEKGGRLYELDADCAQLEIRLASALNTHKSVLETEAKLLDIKGKLKAAKTKAEELGGRIQQFDTRTILELFERARLLEARVETLFLEMEATSSAELSEIEVAETLKSRVAALEAEVREYTEKEAAVAYNKDDPALDEYVSSGGREPLENKLASCRRTAIACTVSGLSAFFGGLAAVTFGLFPKMSGGSPVLLSLIGGGVLVALSIILFICAIVAKRRGDNIETYYDFDVLDREIAEREARLDSKCRATAAREEAERRYAEVCDEVRRVLECEPQEIAAKLAGMRTKLHASDAVKAEYDKNFSLLTQIRSQLVQYSEDELREKINHDVDISDIDSANLPAMRREWEFTAKAAESLEKMAAELEVNLAGLLPTAEDPAPLNDKLCVLKRERSLLEKRHAAYKLAYEKLCEASENVRNSVAPKLAADAAQLMAHITGGKYRELGVGANLDMSVATDGSMRPVSVLSEGTRDAAYLSLRLALISLLYRNSSPPMIFDESFVRQDDGRLTSMLKLVRFRDAQSIIFSSNNRETELVKALGGCNVIEI